MQKNCLKYSSLETSLV